MSKKSFATNVFFKGDDTINWQSLTYVLLGYGILIRLFHFVVNRSLWLDEIYLSSSLLRMSLAQLISTPLDYQQQAPVGILILVKTSVLAFGNSEMALRLIPLLCGIASLFAFYKLAGHFLSPFGVFLSTAIIATAPFLVFHSVEIKQYSSEMLMTVIALLLYTKYNGRRDWTSMWIWGLAGALILWFSHSVIFLLAGIACGLFIYHVAKRNWQKLPYLMLPFSLWMLSFIVHYFIFIYSANNSEWLTIWFHEHNSYMPITSPVSMIKWIALQFYRFLEYPLGLLWSWDEKTFSNFIVRNVLRMPILPMTCFVLGIAAWYRKEKKSFIILIFPILLTLIASVLEFYPVYERLLVFLTPVIVLFIAMGMDRLMAFKWVKPFSILLIPLLLAAPVVSSVHQMTAPEKLGGYKYADYRDTFEYVEKEQSSGDIVYVYWNLLAQYKVYKQISHLSYDVIEGKNLRAQATNEPDYLKKMESDFADLKGKNRVWVMYDNTLNFDIGDMDSKTWYQTGPYGTQPGLRMLNKFRTLGKIIKEYKSKNASAYLIEIESTAPGVEM